MFKRSALPIVVALALSATAPTHSAAQSAATAPAVNSQLATKVESYLRFLFAWGPGYTVKLGSITPSPMPDLEQVPISVTYQGSDPALIEQFRSIGGVENGTVYVTKDGRFMVRGEIRDMSKDPFAETRSKLKLSDSPSVGPTNAGLTVVEFSDFECPHCQEMYSILKTVEPEFPQVRFVYKNFPLEQIHPWAMTAALAGRCVYKQSNSAFMKYQDTIFTNQDAITADNAWDQVTQAAVSAGLTADALHSCMTAPETKAAVEADITEGKSLQVESTPTFFINGRAFQAADRQALEQVIRFDLSHLQDKP
jgi:protein-disulfide isomerase